MAYLPSAFCDRRRQVAAIFLSLGLAVSSLVVPWVASSAGGASPTPTTSVLIPSNGATLSGTAATLDASASNATSVRFVVFGGTYGFHGQVLCTATLTYYGWVCSWNTTTVPNGSYTLTSAASNSGGYAFSPGVSITVSNYQVTNYTAPGIDHPADITAGPDGALWFTNSGTFDPTTKTFIGSSIGRITTAGVVTTYTDPTIHEPQGVTAGPDGALWFTNTANSSIGRITTAGVVTTYTDSSIVGPQDISTGPDGALWFTTSDTVGGPIGIPGSIGRITTAGVVTNYTDPHVVEPIGITAGPDGALWFADAYYNDIGQITTAGVVTTYSASGINPFAITAGPDGALWFTNQENNSIGRITTAGVVTTYTGAGIDVPTGITAGPDGALWFTNQSNDSIGRITTAGVVTNYTGTGISDPAGITAGSDGALWFTNLDNNSIGRITP
jgi:virginiamycin B lyase